MLLNAITTRRFVFLGWFVINYFESRAIRKMVTEKSMAVPIRFFKSKLTCPYQNLAVEDFLFNIVYTPSTHIFLLYRNKPTVVLGRNQNPFKELDFESIHKDRVPISRRQSGGGTVYHDLGNTNYFHIMLRSEFDRKFSVGLINLALHELDIPSHVNNRHDIYIGDKKVSGSAFKLVKDKAYHHGTMLIDSELDKLKLYLNPKMKNMQGGGIESVRSNVTRLRDHSYTADHPSFSEACFKVYSNHFDTFPKVSLFHEDGSRLLLDEIDITSDLEPIIDKLKSTEWIFGQTPKFTLQLDSNIVISVEKGMIVNITGVNDCQSLIGQYLHNLETTSSTNALVRLIHDAL